MYPHSVKAAEDTKLKVCQLSVMADDILYLFCNIFKVNFYMDLRELCNFFLVCCELNFKFPLLQSVTNQNQKKIPYEMQILCHSFLPKLM